MIRNKGIIRFVVIFFFIMLFFTFFSRAISNMLTPKVTYAKPMPLSVSRELEAEAETAVFSGRIMLAAYIPESDITELTTGQYCEFQTDRDGAVRFMSGEIYEIEAADYGKFRIWISPAKELFENDKIFGLKILLPRQTHNLVIPSCSMVTPFSVYVIERRNGFWGEELYISNRPVTVSFSYDGQTVLAEGLSYEDYVVTGWDRPLSDGQRVMLPYYG